MNNYYLGITFYTDKEYSNLMEGFSLFSIKENKEYCGTPQIEADYQRIDYNTSRFLKAVPISEEEFFYYKKLSYHEVRNKIEYFKEKFPELLI